MNNKKIVFIVQQLSQPRCIKRINTFNRFGHDCHVYGFDNNLYNGNLNNIHFEINERWQIDKTQSKVVKICIYIKKISRLLNQINKGDIIYAFGFEIASIVSILWKYKFIYEKADVSSARINNFILRKMFVKIDKRIIRRSLLTVFTSKGFEHYLFPDGNPYSKKSIFLNNKLHPSFIKVKRPKRILSSDRPIRFGFIGLIRYPNTILRFAKVIGENFPHYEFHFFGDSEEDILNQINWSKFNNIKFHGKFKNPQDLSTIYEKIDLNVVCYDIASDNVRIALPNKLYESMFFNVPLIVSQGTFLQKKVDDLKVGYSICAQSNFSINRFIKSLTISDILQKQNNCLKIKTENLVTNPKNDIEIINRFLL